MTVAPSAKAASAYRRVRPPRKSTRGTRPSSGRFSPTPTSGRTSLSIAAARAGLPNEIAGGLIYSPQRTTLRLVIYEPLHSTAYGIEYRMPALDCDESIAVDLHTHGRLPAFWSGTDDVDDRSVKVAGVF